MTIRQTVVSYLLEDTPESRKALRNLVKKDDWTYLMYEDEKNKLRIENYLDGIMPERVMQAFEKMIKKDEKLKREFEQRKKLNDKIIKMVPWIEPLEKAHETFEKEYKNKEFVLKPVLKAEYKKLSFARFSIAASIALLLGLGLLYVISPENQPSNDELFTEYYEPLSMNKSKNSLITNSKAFLEAREKYQEKDYYNAYTIFNSLPDNLNIQMEKNFFIGLSFIEMEQYENAIKNFQSVIDNEYQFLAEAYWYLGLCYLKTGQRDKAVEIFKYIDKANGYNHKKTKKILYKLR